MYAISKKQRDEALLLLAALREKETGRDVRAVNNRRRAGILIRQLEKAREIEFNDVKNLTKVSE